MKMIQGLVVISVLFVTVGCTKSHTQGEANQRYASSYASVNKALKEDEKLTEKELVVCVREKPIGTLIAQTVCRSPELMALDREKTKDRMTRTELRSYTETK